MHLGLVKLESAGTARQKQEVGDDPRHVDGLLVNDLGEFGPLLGVEKHMRILEDVEKADQSSQWCSQFVGNRGHKC